MGLNGRPSFHGRLGEGGAYWEDKPGGGASRWQAEGRCRREGAGGGADAPSPDRGGDSARVGREWLAGGVTFRRGFLGGRGPQGWGVDCRALWGGALGLGVAFWHEARQEVWLPGGLALASEGLQRLEGGGTPAGSEAK